MRFKVGDKVRVREDLKFGSSYENIFVTAGMYENRGLVSEVSDISLGHYELKDDSTNYIWSEGMLEPTKEETRVSENYVKFDIPKWVNWLARDQNNGLYGYFSKPEKFGTIWGVSIVDEHGLTYIGSDPNHYPQVRWCDEEPKQYKDGITFLTGTEKAKAFVPSSMKDTGGKHMKKYERHSEITKQLNEIYIAKNTDYGDAFGDTFKKLGIISAVTRIVDKTNRLMSLSAKTEAERNVKDETIKDTLMDLANYALMTLIEMEELE